MGSTSDRTAREPATTKQLDYVSDLQNKAAARKAREIRQSVRVEGNVLTVGAALEDYIDYIAFSTLPAPTKKGEASRFIQMYQKGAKDYESWLAAYDHIHSKEAWSERRALSDDETFRSELAQFIRGLDSPLDGLVGSDSAFRREVLDAFRARAV